MRITQGIVKYESQMKQIPTHVQYKMNTCRTWNIDHDDHNTPLLATDQWYFTIFQCFTKVPNYTTWLFCS